MKHTHYLIVGAGLAGYSAARAIRDIDTRSAITLIGAEPHAPYDHPPLTKKFMQGRKPLAEVYLAPTEFYRREGIDLHTGVAVGRIEATRNIALLADGREIAFKKALLATGGSPNRLAIPGSDLPNVFYMRTLEDASAIAAHAVAGRRAVIVGGGFIGLELASSLTQRGVHVTLVHRSPRLWSRFAPARMSEFFREYCEQRGVAFHLGSRPAAILGEGSAAAVRLDFGADLPCDFVCVAVGITPNVRLAMEAGLQVADGVVVDETLRTSHPDIYAAGDIAAFPDPIFGKVRRFEHWGNAEYGGRLAGRNMAGGREPYEQLTSVWSDIFDLHLEFAGDETEHDKTILRGRPGETPFMYFYLKEGRMTAYFAVNASQKECDEMGKLIRYRTDLAGKEASLANPAVATASLK